MDEKQTVKMTVNGQEIVFNVSPDDHETLIDEIQPTSKVGPMHNFLIRTVAPESKEDLKQFLKHPTVTMELGGKLVEEVAPKVKITLGE